MSGPVATPEEANAIAALKRLSKTWPKSLWLFSASGTLMVMQKGADGEKRYLNWNDAPDPDAALATINIENDGGDW